MQFGDCSVYSAVQLSPPSQSRALLQPLWESLITLATYRLRLCVPSTLHKQDQVTHVLLCLPFLARTMAWESLCRDLRVGLLHTSGCGKTTSRLRKSQLASSIWDCSEQCVIYISMWGTCMDPQWNGWSRGHSVSPC